MIYNTAGLKTFFNEATINTLKYTLCRTGFPPSTWNAPTNYAQVGIPPIRRIAKQTTAFESAITPTITDANIPKETLKASSTDWFESLQYLDTHPHKRFPSPQSIFYTDASKKGNSFTGAILHSLSNTAHIFHLPQHPNQNTVLHGELAAIHQAVTILRAPNFAGPQTIMTDSLAAIYLIRRTLRKPETIKLNKHRIILQEIAHMLVTRTEPLSIYKVRARSGVAGNDAVEKLAKEAHTGCS